MDWIEFNLLKLLLLFDDANVNVFLFLCYSGLKFKVVPKFTATTTYYIHVRPTTSSIALLHRHRTNTIPGIFTMGLSATKMSATGVDDNCTKARIAVKTCKRKLYDLEPNECYPKHYRGECDALELELKKCLSFALCNSREDATVFYNTSSPRKDRVIANKNLQECLNKNKALRACIPKNNEQ